ncbi:MAG TPA: class I SAM-dependent methyltransferase [Chitinophagaceae bacterium]|jgi:ubiquinone/menaquinone biosynthesis C-methylase UbiE
MPPTFIDKFNIIPTFSTKEKIVLELGSGPAKRIAEAITVDMLDMEGIDIVCNMDEGFPFLEDESVDEIYSFHFLEHVKDVNVMMREIYRVLKKGGKNIGAVPYFANPYFYSDPTHKTTFGLYTFSYFSKIPHFKRRVPTFYNDINFEINKVEFHFQSKFFLRHRIKKLFQRIFNSSRYMKEFYEEQLCYMLPAYELYFELQKR